MSKTRIIPFIGFLISAPFYLIGWSISYLGYLIFKPFCTKSSHISPGKPKFD